MSDKPEWICPACGRSFKKQGQQHFCGAKPESISDYILLQPEERRGELELVYSILKNALPGCEERISWGMPTFWKKRNIIHFAYNKKHIGLYPGEQAVEHFAPELTGYKFSKGAIRIPYGSIDSGLITRIAKYSLDTSYCKEK